MRDLEEIQMLMNKKGLNQLIFDIKALVTPLMNFVTKNSDFVLYSSSKMENKCAKNVREALYDIIDATILEFEYEYTEKFSKEFVENVERLQQEIDDLYSTKGAV